MHSMIIGMTGSGKTSLARQIADSAQRRGIICCLYDPIGSADFPKGTIKFSDPERLLDVLKTKLKNCAVFVDEAPTICGRGKECRPYHWLATMSRHRGHRCYFLAQDATQLDPIFRRNCTHLYLFAVAPATAELLSFEQGCTRLLEASSLPALSYLYRTNFDKDGKKFITTNHKIEFLKSSKKPTKSGLKR